jgi:excinuclease UvrABC nuclease subunit
MSHFGSVKQVMEAKKEELITLIGKSKTEKILTTKK